MQIITYFTCVVQIYQENFAIMLISDVNEGSTFSLSKMVISNKVFYRLCQ